MASHASSSREEDRRVSIQTLIIASIASATAAIITSQFWVRGTPIAAALTPVIVTLVSELLHRPTRVITERLSDTAALRPETDVLPEAAGAGPPPPREEHDPRPARAEPAWEEGRASEVRVYRSSPEPWQVPWKPILATAAIAFAIAAAALTLPELIAGQSVSRGDRNFTLFGGDSKKGEKEPEDERTGETEPEQTAPGAPATEPEETVPELRPPAAQTEPEPEATQETQTAPALRSQPPP